MKLIAALLVVVSTTTLASANQLGIYTFTGAAGNEPTYPVDSQPANATFSVMSRGTGVTPSAASGAFSASGWSTGALDPDDYYEFSITPSSGYSVTLTNLTFAERRSSTGIRDISVRSSLDSFATDIATFNVPDNDLTRTQTVALGASFVGLTGTVTFRLYGYNAEAGTGTWRIDNVALFGSIDSAGPPTTNVQFTISNDVIGEAGGAYTVTVYKTLPSGNISGSVTLSGTASSPADFTINTTNFTMNGSVTSATFVITIVDDATVESAETIVLTIDTITGGTIGSPSTFTLTINDNDVAPPAAGEPWINEFNYDPPGTDSNEFVELAGPAGLDLSNYLLVLYNGAGNVPYSNLFLSGTIPDEGCGYGAVAFDTPGLQNGSPDGIALAKITGGTTTLVQFISYEGPMTGVGGPADGQPSQDVGTQNGILDTLQLAGSGTNYSAFTWVTGTVSRGVLNVGQTISPCGGAPTNVQFTLASATIGEAGGTYTVTVIKTQPSGNVSGSVTLGGTASTPADYTINTTNFTLNGTVTAATFVITIVDDSLTEPNETVTLTLANVVGGTIASPSVFTLTITDNDAPPPATYPTNVIVYQRFEAGGPWTIAAGVGNISTADGAADFPPLQRIEQGTDSWQVNAGSVTLELVQVSISGFTNRVIKARVSSTSLTSANGADVGDFVRFFVALDSATFPTNFTLSLTGNNNARWGFWATNIIDVLATASTSVSAPQGGLNSNNYSTIFIRIPDSATSVALRVWAFNDNSNEVWNVDNIEVLGDPDSSSPYSPAQYAYIVAYWGTIGSYTGDAADDDGDGYSNLEEFIAGTVPVPPTGAADYLRSIAITNAVNRFVVTPSVTGRLYRLWASQQLQGTQAWNQVAGPVPGTGSNLSLTDGVTTNFRVYRLTVELENP